MKILAIGDIHGLDTWKQVVENNTFDLCVFVGDYFDSFDIDPIKQIANFNEIIAFKKSQEDKVIVLTGNHDLHYLVPGEQYSGYNRYKAIDIQEALLDASMYMQYAFCTHGFLFTHAGVTKTWAAANNIDIWNIEQSINSLPLSAFIFNVWRDKSFTGDHKSQGPMWVRPEALKNDAIDGYVQIVGHTRQASIKVETDFAFIDSLWNGEFLSIEDGIMIVNKIV